MNKLVLNVIHRPEMVPEYAQKVTQTNQAESIEDKSLLTESLDIFILQQAIAHENGIKTSIQMTYASLFNEQAVQLAKEHHEKYGDEISLTLLGLPCEQFRNKYKTKDFCIWMFSQEDKQSIVDDVFGLFYEKFGFYPTSTGSYYMDADLINYIKSKYAGVVCAVATCFEEGPKAYHTCNNSWYTFMDGGPWNPWIPSKQNTSAPAENESQDSGIVAIPHLSRDLLACFDGNGSNFGTHPQNVLRGMIYQDGQYPYLFNLIDQYRHLGNYNDGYCYNMMFVGPGWMNKRGRWEAPYELLVKSYRDCMAYYGQLKQEGKLIDMTMTEFAHHYRSIKSYQQPECALWKDILYDDVKQQFWYCDCYMRACLDFNQGGALIDLRPYVAKKHIPVGIGTGNAYDASYPYLIQANYRAGYFTHYAGEGTVASCKIIYKDEEVDMCLCRTKAEFIKEGKLRKLVCQPVTIDFADLSVDIQSTYIFEEGNSSIQVIRQVLNMSKPDQVITIKEYVTASYGTTEYAQDMSGIVLSVGDSSINYEYKCRQLSGQGKASALIPQIDTKLSLQGQDNTVNGVDEGYAFSPCFTLYNINKLGDKQRSRVCLKVQKAN